MRVGLDILTSEKAAGPDGTRQRRELGRASPFCIIGKRGEWWVVSVGGGGEERDEDGCGGWQGVFGMLRFSPMGGRPGPNGAD